MTRAVAVAGLLLAVAVRGSFDPHQTIEVPLVKRKVWDTPRPAAVAAAQAGLSDRAVSFLQNVESMQYVGSLYVNGDKAACIYDTGSGNTWVYSNLCDSTACKTNNVKDVSWRIDSGVHSSGDYTEVTIEYGSGTVKGLQLKGEVSFADCGSGGCGNNCACGPSTDYDAVTEVEGEAFDYGSFNCIVGLAMPNLALGNAKLTVESLMEQGMPHRQFGFYLTKLENRDGSRFHFGPPKAEYYHAPLKTFSLYTKSSSGPSYWTVKMIRMWERFQGQDAVDMGECASRGGSHGPCQAALDTGTSLITGPDSDATRVANRQNANEDCSGMDQLPDFGVELEHNAIDGATSTIYWLSPSSWVLKDVDESGGDFCMSSVTGLTLHGNQYQDFWILGDAFLSSYYSSYDFSCYENSANPCTVQIAAKDATLIGGNAKKGAAAADSKSKSSAAADAKSFKAVDKDGIDHIGLNDDLETIDPSVEAPPKAHTPMSRIKHIIGSKAAGLAKILPMGKKNLKTEGGNKQGASIEASVAGAILDDLKKDASPAVPAVGAAAGEAKVLEELVKDAKPALEPAVEATGGPKEQPKVAEEKAEEKAKGGEAEKEKPQAAKQAVETDGAKKGYKDKKPPAVMSSDAWQLPVQL